MWLWPAAGCAQPADPESRITKNSDGAHIQAYNAQAFVDEQHQIITAADVTCNASDALNYTTLLDQSVAQEELAAVLAGHDLPEIGFDDGLVAPVGGLAGPCAP